MIGKFEELVLLSLMRAGPEALASKVYAALIDRLGKEKSFGAVYTTLDRLVDKDYIAVTTPKVKTGKKRRYFTITGEGRAVLAKSMSTTVTMAEGLSLPGLAGGV